MSNFETEVRSLLELHGFTIMFSDDSNFQASLPNCNNYINIISVAKNLSKSCKRMANTTLVFNSVLSEYLDLLALSANEIFNHFTSCNLSDFILTPDKWNTLSVIFEIKINIGSNGVSIEFTINLDFYTGFAIYFCVDYLSINTKFITIKTFMPSLYYNYDTIHLDYEQNSIMNVTSVMYHSDMLQVISYLKMLKIWIDRYNANYEKYHSIIEEYYNMPNPNSNLIIPDVDDTLFTVTADYFNGKIVLVEHDKSGISIELDAPIDCWNQFRAIIKEYLENDIELLSNIIRHHS